MHTLEEIWMLQLAIIVLSQHDLCQTNGKANPAKLGKQKLGFTSLQAQERTIIRAGELGEQILGAASLHAQVVGAATAAEGNDVVLACKGVGDGHNAPPLLVSGIQEDQAWIIPRSTRLEQGQSPEKQRGRGGEGRGAVGGKNQMGHGE